jgi:general secretion pathway protein E
MNTPAAPALRPISYRGNLDWQRLIAWLQVDGTVSADEAARASARCAQGESAQHPVLRLASLGVRRAADQKILDAEALLAWLAPRAGLAYLRIDPLKVDVSKVAEAFTAAYAQRHKVLPVAITATEIVVATCEPFATDWLAEVERQSRRRVRLVLSTRKTLPATPPSFMPWRTRCVPP